MSDLGRLANQAADTLLSAYRRCQSFEEREEVSLAIARVMGDGAKLELDDMARRALEGK